MKRQGRATLSWLALSLPAVVMLAALGYLPTQRIAGRDGLLAMGAGCTVSWCASALAAIPVLAALRGGGSPTQTTVGWTMALRFLGTLVGTVVLVLGSDLPRVALVVWVMSAYAVLLVVETRWMTRWLQPARG